MGHRNLRNTLIYTQLLQFDEDENYTVKASQTTEQDMELMENGFEFHTERDGIKLFRKRK